MVETTILVVDPSASDRKATVEAFQSAFPDANVLAVASYNRATTVLDEQTVDELVTRHSLGDGTGVELTAYVREEHPETDCFLYAEQREIETESFEEIIVEYVPRDGPDAEETLISLIRQAETDPGQVPYPLPDDETERLASLDEHSVDTQQASSALEQIAELARQHFDVAAGAILLVDERTQQHLAQSGSITPPTDRESSLSTYTLVENGVMDVEDIEIDERFSDTQLQESDIVAYLGASIETPEGFALGSLNVYHDDVREFSAADHEYLSRLAALVADVLELTRQSPAADFDTGGEGP
jgi:GAF domain-containing protein